jgi:hypothetical protein
MAGLFVTGGMLFLWTVVFPAAIMLIAVYISRAFPLGGQRGRRARDQDLREVKTGRGDRIRNSDPGAPTDGF